MKVKMTIEVEVDNSFGESEDEKLWLENEVLIGNRSLFLHSNEIGDTIGEVSKVSNIVWYQD